MYGLPRQRVGEVLAQVGLADQARAKLDKLPKGLYTYYKKRCLTCEHLETYNRFYD